jgi:hypothetical protein
MWGWPRNRPMADIVGARELAERLLLVLTRLITVKPAHAVLGPKHVVKRDKTPVPATLRARLTKSR